MQFFSCNWKYSSRRAGAWSSSYGRRLMFRRLWVQIPASWMNFFHIYLLYKLCWCLFEKTQIKWKRGRGWPIFFKKVFESIHWRKIFWLFINDDVAAKKPWFWTILNGLYLSKLLLIVLCQNFTFSLGRQSILVFKQYQRVTKRFVGQWLWLSW